MAAGFACGRPACHWAIEPASYETEGGRCSFEEDVLYLAVLLVGDYEKTEIRQAKTQNMLLLTTASDGLRVPGCP